MANITITNHPLIQHKLSILRDKHTASKEFRTLVGEIAMLMCYEAQSIYKGYAEANVPSDYAPKKKNGAFRPIAEAFFTPTFLIVVIIFVVASITR